MKKIILFLLAICGVLGLQAQDEGVFNHYHIAPALLHPASVGFDNSHHLLLHARAAWTGFSEAPQTAMAQYHGPIGTTFGLGVLVGGERAADLNRSRVRLNYSFRFGTQEKWQFAAGFATEFQRWVLTNDAAQSNFVQGGDEVLQSYMDGRNIFDASVGVYAAYRQNTRFGLSFLNLVRSRLDGLSSTSTPQSFFTYYALTAAHRIDVVDLNFTLEPSIMVRQMRNAPFMADINIKAGFMDDQLVAGLSYRSLGLVGVLLGTKFSGIQLYYGYDVSFQNFQQYSGGLHEITFAFNFRKKDKTGSSSRHLSSY